MDKASLKQIVPRIGQLLKLFRENTGRNQGDIASKAGISVSMLSQIERGIVSPSIDTLVMVCQALDLAPADLFKLLSTDRPVRIHHQGERLTMINYGIRYEQLMTSSQSPSPLELFLLEVEPGCHTTLSNEGHQGIEIGYILQGSAVLIVDNENYAIKKGDSIFFNSSLPHQLHNQGIETFKAIWSISPPHVDYLRIDDEKTS